MVNPNVQIPEHHEIEFRVRYQETDAQGRVHHANFLNYFEMGRVEMLRAGGVSYREIEAEGFLLVIADMQVKYYLLAEFDDLLRLETQVERAKGARIEHSYKLHRGEVLLAEARSVVACVSRSGRIQRLPEWLKLKREEKAET